MLDIVFVWPPSDQADKCPLIHLPDSTLNIDMYSRQTEFVSTH